MPIALIVSILYYGNSQLRFSWLGRDSKVNGVVFAALNVKGE